MANNTGLASPAELRAETASPLGILGIGWNLDHLDTTANGMSPTGAGGGLERYEIEQAAALKAARPGIGVMVLRNTEVISTFWSSGRKAMQDPALWIQDPPGSGRPHSEPWGTDDRASGPPTPKYFLNFSNPATQRWWVNEYVPKTCNAFLWLSGRSTGSRSHPA